MDNIKDKLHDAIKKTLKVNEVNLEIPENENFGDYSSNIALLGKKQNPRQVAEHIVKKLKTDKDLLKICDRIEIAGPGFINFWLKKDILVDNLKQIDIGKENFGKSVKGKGKTVVIDYSSPNIAKPFGIGHLRSTIIGQTLYNLYKELGYEVIGDNHLGDWGTQFGKLIYMIKEEKPKDLSIETLEKLYVEFHKHAEVDPALEEKARECFKKLEEGDSEAKNIWQKCVDISMKEFDRVYQTLGVKIDFAFGESYYTGEMKGMVVDPGIRRRLVVGEEGAMVVDLSQYGIKTPLMFTKSDGATTYATRDLATIKFRMRKWSPDLIIYEVGAEQTLHFQQVFAAANALGLVKSLKKFVHTAHGLYLAPDGKKFSTRKGKTIKLMEVLDEAIQRAEKLGGEKSASAKATARQVGIGAIKYFDLMHAVKSDVVFDWDKIMNLEGNSGPYLQYTVARCNSVLAKSGNWKTGNLLITDNWKLVTEEEAILRYLVHFPEIIEEAAENFAPNLLCNYLYDLAQKYNHFYNSCPILNNSDESVTNFRLALTNATAQVLKNGLKILGIQTPQKM